MSSPRAATSVATRTYREGHATSTRHAAETGTRNSGVIYSRDVLCVCFLCSKMKTPAFQEASNNWKHLCYCPFVNLEDA